MKEVDVTSAIIISAPVNRVAAFSSNPDNAPAWYENIKSVKWISTPPMQVGSQMAFTAQFLGRKLSYVYEVALWEPGQKLIMKTADGPFPMETTYCWEKVNETETRMVLRNRGYPSGFSKWIKPLMVFMMKRANTRDLQLLKKIMEQ